MIEGVINGVNEPPTKHLQNHIYNHDYQCNSISTSNSLKGHQIKFLPLHRFDSFISSKMVFLFIKLPNMWPVKCKHVSLLNNVFKILALNIRSWHS